ncbi:hypothetical protein MUP77_13445 [Candidatus Bathyarchaeota archaeon]|nr:hypothetical protein [Candidatus Bathyarchaeota archaeon]
MVRADSLRKKVYDEWVKNPYLPPKKVCENLGLVYADHGNYVHKLLSEYRSYYQFGSAQKAHVFPKHRVFEWDGVPRSLLPCEADLGKLGWKAVSNRNGMWVFRDPRGAVHWYREGLVRLYLRGELQLAKAKELFCKAFNWFGSNDLRKYLDVPLEEKYRKWTFDVGSPVPRFDIRRFEKSHGLRIFTDGSDLTSIHVGESVPFWIDEQRQSTQELGAVVKVFGQDIQEHLKLIHGAQDFIKEVYEEAKEWRAERKNVQLKPIKREKRPKAPSQKTILEWMI